MYVREDCLSCDAVQRALENYCRDKEYLALKVVDLDHGGKPAPGKQAYITPAVWVNGRLWNLGGFNLPRFNERIRRLVEDMAKGDNGSLTPRH